MSDQSANRPISLAELDARHDELLCQLEALDQRIRTVLKENLPAKAVVSPTAGTDGPLPAPALTADGTASGLPRLICDDLSAPIC